MSIDKICYDSKPKFKHKGKTIKGTILSNGILRAEDGKRYTFKLDEIQNLSKFPYTDEHSLDGIEVDFETGENNEATSLFLITTKEAKITPPPPPT